MSLTYDIKYQLKYGSVITKLIVINILVFLFGGLINLFVFMNNLQFNFANEFLSMPSNLSKLAYKPWTLLAYQFSHSDLFHLISNMLILYFSGRIFTDFFLKKDTWLIYLLGGFTGAILYLITFNFFTVFQNSNSTLIGASGSILAILFAATAYAPNLRVSIWGIFELKLLWLSFGFLLLDLITIPASNAGGHIAHIGGALLGWFYARHKQNNLNWFSFNFFKEKSMKNYKVEINKNVKTKTNKNNPSQDEVDAILDKISKNGYDRLSKEEKDILFKASQDK